MKSKFYACIGFAAILTSFVLADDSPKTVTYRSVAAPASKVVPELGKAVGMTLTADGPIGKAVLLIQVKDAPLNDVLARIAQVTSGTWEKHDGYTALILSTDLARDERKAELNARAVAIKKALDLLSDAGASGGALGDSSGVTQSTMVVNQPGRRGGGGQPFVTSFSGNANGPAGRTIVKLLQAIGATDLAKLQPITRTVYALPATRAQINLPGGSAKLIEAMMAEINSTGVSSQPDPQGNPRRRPNNPNQPVQAPIAKVHLIITRDGFGDGIMAELRVGNASGQVMARGMVMVSPVTTPVVSDVRLKNPAKWIDLSEDGKFLAKALNIVSPRFLVGGGVNVIAVRLGDSSGATGSFPPGTDSDTSKGMSAALKDRVTKPEENDPLSFVVGEAIGKLGDTEETNLIACLPDSSLHPASTSFSVGRLSADKVVKDAMSTWDLKVDLQSGWLLLSPSLPATARDARMDRISLGKTMRLLVSQGILSLDQKAAFAVQQPFVQPDLNFERPYLTLVNPAFATNMQSAVTSGERKMLRFYAGLGASQKQTLASGRSIGLSTLTPSQKTILDDMTFGSTTYLNIGAGGDRRPPIIGAMNDMTRDATEVLPNGTPTNGFLSVAINGRDAVFGVADNGARTNANGFSGTFVMDGTSGGGRLVTDSASQFAKYQIGKSSTFVFTFQLLPEVSFTKTLIDDQVDTKSKNYTYDELPDWYRQRIEATERNLQRIQQQIQQGQSQRQVPPQP